jgi:hypothetical protein
MLLQDDAKEEEEDEDQVVFEETNAACTGSDCHFGKKHKQQEVAATTQQVHTKLINDQAISGAHARAFSLASLGTQPETGAEMDKPNGPKQVSKGARSRLGPKK